MENEYGFVFAEALECLPELKKGLRQTPLYKSYDLWAEISR